MNKLYTYPMMMLVGLQVQAATAQRINFSTYVQGEGISVTAVANPAGLNFNNQQRVLVVGDPTPVSIGLNDNPVVIYEIDAPIEYDLTIEFNAETGLSYLGLDTGVTVPFQFRFAYNNTGEFTEAERRMSAVEVPDMFNVVTIPVRRRGLGGPPLPPPTPEHAGFVRPRGKAYLYLYGVLGPIPTGIRAGNYSGDIQIQVSYADNTF